MTSPAQKPALVITRVALALGSHVVRELDTSAKAKITVGHSERCDFVVPLHPASAKHTLVNGDTLDIPASLEGRLVLGGVECDVAALRADSKTKVKLAPEDWGVLWLRERTDCRFVVLRVASEPVPPLPPDRSARPVYASTALSAIAFGILLGITFLNYDPGKRTLELDTVDERFTRAIFNDPPREPPPPEEDKAVDESKEADKSAARKRAGGEEGRYGRPDLHARSNIPKTSDAASSNATNVGLVKELNTLAQTDTMANLLSVGGVISGTDSGPLIIGNGTGGMGTRGSGSGGGGEGEGSIHGTAKVDTGGAGTGVRAKTAKPSSGPKEREVSVTTGTAKVKGQLSKELIDKEVRRHRPQISFCYNAQLTRKPDLSGKVTLSWIIRLDGSVSNAKVKSSSLGNSDAESCMVRALGGWRFPKPEGGVVEVEYPFVFDTK